MKAQIITARRATGHRKAQSHWSAADFLRGDTAHALACERHQVGKHQYKAEWVIGAGIVVKDAEGAIVNVSYAGTTDNRTCYAYVDDIGFIGGWQYPHKEMPFKALVESINRGKLYHRQEKLPKTHRPKVCPHCGAEL